MSAIEEKRMYGQRREETVAYVATGQGVATVAVSGDQIGRFALAEQCLARDVAAADDRVFVATDGDVLVGPEPFESLDFGEAVAVGFGADPLAADKEGRVSRYRDGEWSAVGSVESVRAIDGGMVAASDGVYRVGSDGLDHVGLTDVADVATAGAPLAAAGDGLYRLGNGWLREREGAFEAVTADVDHAHAATDETLYERDADEWVAVDLPVDESVVDVAYGECVYAVTEPGTFLVDADPERTADGAGGWRARSLGLPDVRAVAVL